MVAREFWELAERFDSDMDDVVDKRCSKCQKDKSVGDFYLKSKKTGSLNVWCKACMKEYDKKRYQNFDPQKRIEKTARQQQVRITLRNKVLKYLTTHPCVDCGESDPVVLEFDHRSDKDLDISYSVSSGLSEKTVFDEIAKCDVRCANCHRRKTAKDFGWHRYKMLN